MAAVSNSPCEWEVLYTSFRSADEVFASAAEQALFESMATAYLWEWTDRRYGLCEVVLRPCRSKCGESWSAFDSAMGVGYGYPGLNSGRGWMPVLIGGAWHNITCGSCGGDDCSCGTVPRINLPGPVSSVVSVEIDGVTVGDDTYRLDGSTLIRESGRTWPDCQYLALPLGEEGTWAVTYMRGLPVPTGGKFAAGALAIELYKSMRADSSDCSLPPDMQESARRALSGSELDATVGKGYTGIWLVDSWLTSITRPRPSSGVRSPDYGKLRTLGGGGSAASGGGPSASTTVAAETSFAIASSAGSSAAYSRGDHTHGTPAAPTAISVGADATGTAATAVANHEIAADPHTGYTLETRLITAGAGLTGGGDLSADRTLAVSYGTASSTATQGNDSRLRDDTFPLSGYGLIAASGDPMAWGPPSTIANNDRFFARIWVPAGVTITGMYTPVRVAGTHDGVSSPNALALFDDDGVALDQTPDDPTLWTVVGWRGGLLSGGTIAAQSAGRFVYGLWIVRGVTGASIVVPHNPNDANGSWIGLGVGTTKRRGGYSSGSTIPASIDPSTFGTASSYMPLIGLTGAAT